LKKKIIPSAEEAFRYLGAKIGTWKGMYCEIIVPKIMSVLKTTRK
jgi:hypothetical protein